MRNGCNQHGSEWHLVPAATVDLNAGNIDGVAIGDASQSTAKFTNVTASSLRVTSSLTATATGLEISSAEVTGTLTANQFDVTSTWT